MPRRHGTLTTRRFYQAFGHNVHIEHHTSDDADRSPSPQPLSPPSGLPAVPITAATDAHLDATPAVVSQVEWSCHRQVNPRGPGWLDGGSRLQAT